MVKPDVRKEYGVLEGADTSISDHYTGNPIKSVATDTIKADPIDVIDSTLDMIHSCPVCHSSFNNLTLPETVDSARLIRFKNRGLHLTAIGYLLVQSLVERFGKVRSKDSILDFMYSDTQDCDIPDYRILDVIVCKLRPAVRELGLNIITVRGSGYMLGLAEKEET